MTEIPAPYGNNPQYQFEAQYRRILEITKTRTQVELAKFLAIRQSTISDAKRRESIPSDWLMKLFIKTRVNPEWILYGEGSKYLTPTDTEQDTSYSAYNIYAERSVEIRPPQDCSAQALVNELVRRAIGDR